MKHTNVKGTLAEKAVVTPVHRFTFAQNFQQILNGRDSHFGIARVRGTAGNSEIRHEPAFLRLSELVLCRLADNEDRKCTRLNSSHLGISYAVFCVKTTS